MHGMREKLSQKGTVMQKKPHHPGAARQRSFTRKGPLRRCRKGPWKFWQNKNAAGVSAAYLSATESDGPLKRDPKGRNQTALSTLLERRHLVQAYTWQGVPLTTALTRFTLGFQARLERLWEWETLIPKVTPLPQKSHFAIHCTSHPDNSLNSCVSFERLDIIAKIEEKSKSFFHFFLFIFRLIFFCTLV